jgi:hypothetical protein
VIKHINSIEMSQETDVPKLQARIKDLEKKLLNEELKTEALTIMIRIGEEDYGLDLRKKYGAKQLKK